jgi:hypothetical protein
MLPQAPNLIPDSYKLFCVKIKRKIGIVVTEHINLLQAVVSLYKRADDTSKNKNNKIV